MAATAPATDVSPGITKRDMSPAVASPNDLDDIASSGKPPIYYLELSDDVPVCARTHDLIITANEQIQVQRFSFSLVPPPPLVCRALFSLSLILLLLFVGRVRRKNVRSNEEKRTQTYASMVD